MTADRDGAQVPRPFGKYQLLDLIGTGGMAEIYRARAAGPEGFEKTLVVKKILPEFASNRSFIQMLIAEAKVTSLLQHPNIVQIFELGEYEAQYYIAMELVDGSDLLNVLARCTHNKLRVPTEIALYIVSEVCKGLAHAHAATDAAGRALNIVHRDVSPSNILLSLTGDVKIMDFGVATADFGRSSGPIDPGRRSLKGKIGYLSPEQVLGRPIDRRSDIFALGVILFECLTLKRLFVGKSDVQTLVNIREASIERKFKRHSYIPKPIRDILRIALARDPRHRFQTATDFQEAILDYLFEHRLRVTSRSVATFLRQVLEVPPSRRRPRPETAASIAIPARPAPPPSPPPTPPPHASQTPPPLPASATADLKPGSVLSRNLRRVDLTRASFHFRNDGEGVFGPIDFERMNTLLHARCVGPREWVSINGSDWIRACDVPALVDLAPALFEEEAERPLFDGPMNRVRTPHLLHQIHAGGLDGKLKLQRGTVVKEIYFEKGAPVFISSNLKQELLGAYLIHRELADPDAVAKALEASNLRTPIGRALLDSHAITEAGLRATLRSQLSERLVEPFAWRSGWYEFFVGILAPHRLEILQQTPPELLMEGIRRHYDLGTLRRTFDGYLHRPMVIPRDLHHRRDHLGLQPEEVRAREPIRGNATLSQLLQGHGLTEADRLHLLRVAFALYQTDLLTFRARALA